MLSHRFVAFATCTAVAVLSGIGPAGAAFFGTPVSGAPAPLIGIGLPVVGLVAGAVWLVRRVKN
jgi:hypothetical protein